MKFKHLLATLTASGALLATVPAAHAANGVAYDVAGSYISGPGGEGTFAYSYDGTATCAANCTGAPSGGTFSLGLTGALPLAPPNPCLSRRVNGTLNVTWSDATTTTATLAGKLRDRKGFSLSGSVTAGTNPFYPPEPITPVSGFVGFPPNPCTPGSFAGQLSFFPPSPL
jgi:hypothetical protein